MNAKKQTDSGKKSGDHPFRSAVFRGLAVVLPPLLTIVIFLWISGTVEQYVLEPVTTGTRNSLAWALSDIRHQGVSPTDQPGAIQFIEGVEYRLLDDRSYVPWDVYHYVETEEAGRRRPLPVPPTAEGLYQRYVEMRYLKPHVVIPFFLALFILLLYLLGKFMAAGIGRIFWNMFERGIGQVPLVRNVYSSVKQVSDFLLSGTELEYSRVVAVEWPRRGIWSLGLVTGDSLKDIEAAANEPVLSVLVCTSPMPMTGFTVTVRKSETIDLDITIDQAVQFIVSCGVVVPPQQLGQMRSSLKAPPPLVESDQPAESSAN